MVRTQIMLSEEQLERLRNWAAAEGISVAELIRRLIDASIPSSEGRSSEERRRRALAAVGAGRSGLSDLSERHDHYLDEEFGL